MTLEEYLKEQSWSLDDLDKELNTLKKKEQEKIERERTAAAVARTKAIKKKRAEVEKALTEYYKLVSEQNDWIGWKEEDYAAEAERYCDYIEKATRKRFYWW